MQHHMVASYLPEVPRWFRIRKFSHARRAAVLPHVRAGDFKATFAVGTNWCFKRAMSAVIAYGAALGRERQTNMDASPSAVEFGVL